MLIIIGLQQFKYDVCQTLIWGGESSITLKIFVLRFCLSLIHHDSIWIMSTDVVSQHRDNYYRLVFVFLPFFSLYFNFGNFYWPILRFTDSFFWDIDKLSKIFFISFDMHFIFSISLLFLIIYYIPLSKFPMCSHMLSILTTRDINILSIIILIFLSINSSIWVISEPSLLISLLTVCWVFFLPLIPVYFISFGWKLDISCLIVILTRV